jgi:hypothetical protein
MYLNSLDHPAPCMPENPSHRQLNIYTYCLRFCKLVPVKHIFVPNPLKEFRKNILCDLIDFKSGKM